MIDIKPALSLFDADATQPSNAETLKRSASFKTSKREKKPSEAVGLDADLRGLCEDELRRRAQEAWARVKEFVQTRKDASQTTDAIDHVYCSISREGSAERGRPRERLTKTTQQQRDQLDTNAAEAGMSGVVLLSPELRALVGNLSDEFNRKMDEWEKTKKRKGRGDASDDGATKFSEDFIRRMEEWEKMKGIGATLHPPSYITINSHSLLHFCFRFSDFCENSRRTRRESASESSSRHHRPGFT